MGMLGLLFCYGVSGYGSDEFTVPRVLFFCFSAWVSFLFN